MMDENGRQAAGFKIGISNYVATATLAVLAGLVVLFTYIQQSFKTYLDFYICVASAVLSLVASLIFGGLGCDKVATKVLNNEPNTNLKVSFFDYQAKLALLGLIFVVAAAAFGTIHAVRLPTNYAGMQVTQLSSTT